MRITFISPFYNPSIGGVETIVKQTAEELARRKHTVSVVTTNYDYRWTRVTEPKVTIENNVTVYRLPPRFPKIGNATLINGIKKTIIQEKPDIVHSHNLHPHLFQLIKWKKAMSYKLVAQLHYPEAAGINSRAINTIYKIALWFLRYQQRMVDAFVVHTDSERIWLASNKFDQSKMCKLNYPCVAAKFFENHLDNDECINGAPSFAGKKSVLFVGRMTWRKGVHTLIEAMPNVVDDFKETMAVVAGPTDLEYGDLLLSLVKKLHLNNNVIFYPALSEETKVKFMLSCSVFVSPSIKDCHPITLTEAQALGKPVISTNVGAISEIVKNGETGLLVEPENPKMLADAIKRLFSNNEKRCIMGLKAEQYVRDNFLLESVVSKLERLYVDCLNS